eukprot:403338517
MPYKLYYFNSYGRAEPIRMLLSHAKVEFEDHRINGEQVAELKAAGKLEFGQVPLLEHDGKYLVQSWSILRYLGKIHGYYPETSEEAWQADSILDAVEDYFGKYVKAAMEKDEERKKVLESEFLAFLPGWITAIQKRIENNSDHKYIVGTKRSIADIVLASLAFSFIFNEANPHFAVIAPFVKKEDYPVFAAYLEGLKEEFKEYLASRPQPSPF